MIFRRRVLRERYKACFDDVDGVEVFGAEGDEHDNAWLTSILVDSDVTGWEPSILSAALTAENIESRPLWKPMHLQPVLLTRAGRSPVLQRCCSARASQCQAGRHSPPSRSSACFRP